VYACGGIEIPVAQNDGGATDAAADSGGDGSTDANAIVDVGPPPPPGQ